MSGGGITDHKKKRKSGFQLAFERTMEKLDEISPRASSAGLELSRLDVERLGVEMTNESAKPVLDTP